MRRIIFSLACALFIACAAIVVLPMMGALFDIVSVDSASTVFAYLIAYGPFYALALFGSFVLINVTAE